MKKRPPSPGCPAPPDFSPVRPQFSLDINDELIVDNFAGGGGASTGIELALGRHVDIAINHDPEAVAMHQANHPQTLHLCESVWDVDPVEATKGRPVGLAWFSPDCAHFSKAKGGKPREKKIRGLAWVVLRWVVKLRQAHGRGPRVIYLENVEEFQAWGPLLRDGTLNQACKGNTFRSFIGALRRRGYVVEWRELRACDYGAPTIRKRLFLIARCDGQPVVWPAPTHGAPDSKEVKAGRLKPWRTAAECIDWTLRCPSIFERKRSLASATCRRVAKGIMRYVVNNPQPFIVLLTHHGETAPNGSKRWGSGTRTMQRPLNTVAAGGGNTTLVSAFLAKHFTGVVGADMKEPVATVTAIDHHSLVAAHLTKLRGTSTAQAADAPLYTVSAGGTHFAEVHAFLIKYYGNEKEGVELKEPMHTVTARDRFGLVQVNGEEYAIADIGLRMLAPRELFKAQGFPDSYNIGDAGMHGLTLTKSAQVRMCGNSVCPPLVEALVRANVPELSRLERKERVA